MNELQHFYFKGRQVRTLNVDNEPMFVGKDVADILGYQNGSRDVNTHVEEEDRLKYQIGTSGQAREMTIINESGLYSLVLSSKLPTAKEFKHWVTHEVLPSIRKHGAYMTPETIEKAIYNPDFIINLATQLKDEQAKTAELTADNETMKPKALFADAVATSHTTILVGDLAKVIKQNGVDIGAKRLFAWLREQGYLIKRIGADYNSPTQRAMELGLFEVKETAISHSDGHVTVQKTPKVTGKGQQYFINKFLQKEITV
ncbi:phage antirepressor [Lacticaseibacillus paracasei]|uniref:phage antirepressor n=1 Tax=Lacticaseibacillus paracasei TaxID=1597 RepID=UPI00124B0DFF|nr:phage antirepressor KilAC domain-containing protein [Lacticaseibacillus paracasei]KAB1966193.1 phage repressor protein/antirepressor Ant [Lacticaseibacillus paracasei]MCT3331524.1 phage repressor protein/antirepressor Ant [Lacticaseibacillus paracasei]